MNPPRRPADDALKAKVVERTARASPNDLTSKTGQVVIKAMDSRSFDAGRLARILTSTDDPAIHSAIWELVTSIITKYAFMYDSGAFEDSPWFDILVDARRIQDSLGVYNGEVE